MIKITQIHDTHNQQQKGMCLKQNKQVNTNRSQMP